MHRYILGACLLVSCGEHPICGDGTRLEAGVCVPDADAGTQDATFVDGNLIDGSLVDGSLVDTGSEDAATSDATLDDGGTPPNGLLRVSDDSLLRLVPGSVYCLEVSVLSPDGTVSVLPQPDADITSSDETIVRAADAADCEGIGFFGGSVGLATVAVRLRDTSLSTTVSVQVVPGHMRFAIEQRVVTGVGGYMRLPILSGGVPTDNSVRLTYPVRYSVAALMPELADSDLAALELDGSGYRLRGLRAGSTTLTFAYLGRDSEPVDIEIAGPPVELGDALVAFVMNVDSAQLYSGNCTRPELVVSVVDAGGTQYWWTIEGAEWTMERGLLEPSSERPGDYCSESTDRGYETVRGCARFLDMQVCARRDVAVHEFRAELALEAELDPGFEAPLVIGSESNPLYCPPLQAITIRYPDGETMDVTNSDLLRLNSEVRNHPLNHARDASGNLCLIGSSDAIAGRTLSFRVEYAFIAVTPVIEIPIIYSWEL